MAAILLQPSRLHNMSAAARCSASSTRMICSIRDEAANTSMVRASVRRPASGIQSGDVLEGMSSFPLEACTLGVSTITTAARTCMVQSCLCLLGDGDAELLLPLACLG